MQAIRGIWLESTSICGENYNHRLSMIPVRSTKRRSCARQAVRTVFSERRVRLFLCASQIL
jgi:hypothetical protein